MKAVVLTAPGGVEHFRLMDVPLPVPRPDEVRIRVHAAAFNPADCQTRRELPPAQAAIILGGEVAGIVDAVGDAVHHVTVGDAVYAYLPRTRGGYAEFVCTSAAFVARKPARLSFAHAAAVPVAGLTAYQCVVHKAQIQPGDAIFIAGGSGGVGTFAVQLARFYGATPIVTTTGSPRSTAYLTEVLGLPPAHLLFYPGQSHAELVEQARQINGGNLYRITLDCVGHSMTSLCCDLVDFDGHVISIVDGPRDALHTGGEHDTDRLFNRSATFHFVLLYARARFAAARTWNMYHQHLTHLADLLEQQQIQPPAINTVGTLAAETVQAAHMQLETGHVQGKLVMVMA
jgi:NADPH:quinone reductase